MKNKKKGVLIAVAVAVIVVIAVAAVCLNRKTDNAGAVSEGRTESADKTKKSDKADKEESESTGNSDAQVITFAVPDICKIDKNNLKKFNDALAADGHDYELEIKTLSYDHYQAIKEKHFMRLFQRIFGRWLNAIIIFIRFRQHLQVMREFMQPSTGITFLTMR